MGMKAVGNRAMPQKADARQRDCDEQPSSRAWRTMPADQGRIGVLRLLKDEIEAAIEEIALVGRRLLAQPEGALRRLQGRRIDGADQGRDGDHERELR